MLGPAGSTDVKVDVIRTYANPEHGSQVPHWIALVRVQHELGQGGSARCKIQHQWIIRISVAVGREVRAFSIRSRVGDRAFLLAANDYANVIAPQAGKLVH